MLDAGVGGEFTGLESDGERMLKSHWYFGATPFLLLLGRPMTSANYSQGIEEKGNY